jgi:hypothetical protein
MVPYDAHKTPPSHKLRQGLRPSGTALACSDLEKGGLLGALSSGIPPYPPLSLYFGVQE